MVLFLAAERTRFGHWLESSPALIRRFYVLSVVFLGLDLFSQSRHRSRVGVLHGSLWRVGVPERGFSPCALSGRPPAQRIHGGGPFCNRLAAESLEQHPRHGVPGGGLTLEWGRSAVLVLTLACSVRCPSAPAATIRSSTSGSRAIMDEKTNDTPSQDSARPNPRARPLYCDLWSDSFCGFPYWASGWERESRVSEMEQRLLAPPSIPQWRLALLA